jgi:hypothetical protein
MKFFIGIVLLLILVNFVDFSEEKRRGGGGGKKGPNRKTTVDKKG